MSEEIFNRAMEALNETNRRLGAEIEAEIDGDNALLRDAMSAVATAHVACAVWLMLEAGGTPATLAKWLRQIADNPGVLRRDGH